MKIRIQNLIPSLLLLLALTVTGVGETRAAIPYTRTNIVSAACVGTARTRVATRQLLFSEALVKYGQFQNYLHTWLDRPLFADRALRPATMAYDTTESFAIHLREALKYGLDGLGAFATQSGSYEPALAWTEQSGIAGAQLLLLFGYGESGVTNIKTIDQYVQYITLAQASARAPRINGKVLVGGYNYRLVTDVETRRNLYEGLRAGVGNDDFLLMGDIGAAARARLVSAFRANGALSATEQAELVQLIDDVLDWTDGLQVTLSDYVRDPTGPYCSYYDFTFFTQCMAPALLTAYARAENAGKILGAYVNQGYINHMSGMNHGEFGTSTLRAAMDAILGVNPDFLVFFEWNEVNENTMFQPTVYNGQTIGRLIRHYADLMRGETHAAYAGDDPNVPSVVLSHPVTFKPGENVSFEILNIPAAESAAQHVVRLQLLDENGAILTTFPDETMNAQRLESVTLTVPGEAFPAGSSIMPRLTVDGRAYAGFHPIRSDATARFIYKEARGSLRDLMTPTNAAFSVTKTAEGTYAFAADVAFEEPLASLELVANEDEVAAYDVSNEYDRAENDFIRLAFTTRPGTGGSVPVDLTFVDAEGARIAPDWKANVNPALARTSTGYRLHTFYFSSETPYLVTIPTNTPRTAKIVIDATKAWNGARVELPVADVLDTSCWSTVLATTNGFRVDARRFDNLPDLPFQPQTNRVAWSGSVRHAHASPTFHLRAVSTRGRLWRSAPIRPIPAGTTKVETRVFSEWAKGTTNVTIAAELLPEIDYAFSPTCGAAMACRGDPRYDAQLGGGFCDLYAMSEASAFVGVEGGDVAPQWRTDADGTHYLHFDGRDDYATFPVETIPLGPFTLEMEFRPELTTTNMVLFRHSALWRASLCLFLVGDGVYGMWADRDFNNPKYSTRRFDTGLRVTDREWNLLRVSYDYTNITFRLNDTRTSYPFDRRAYVFRPAIFGGHIVTSDMTPSSEIMYFRGDLRRFAVRHQALAEDARNVFFWRRAHTEFGDFTDPANWSLSEYGAVNPNRLIPGTNDLPRVSAEVRVGANYGYAKFDLAATTQTIAGYSGVTPWRSSTIDLTNGCLTVLDPTYFGRQSLWYTIWNGATLVYPDTGDGKQHPVAPSGLMEGWIVKRGGRGEMHGGIAVCGTSSDRVAFTVEEGGTLLFEPITLNTTSVNYGQYGAVFENHGTFLAPRGIDWNARSYSSVAEVLDKTDRLRFRQVAGTFHLGGDFTKSARNFHYIGEMTFELAGGTLEVTNTVQFYTAEAAKDATKGWGEQVFAEMPTGATATVDVKGGSCLILTNATFGAETTLVKRGPGRLILTAANRPTTIVKEEGRVTLPKGRLVIRPVPISLPVGTEATGNGYRVFGLLDGDRAEDVVWGEPLYDFGDYTPDSPAGTYAVSLKGLDSDDYEIVYESSPICAVTPEDGRVFYWTSATDYADAGAISNWSYAADFATPAERLPCSVDQIWGNGIQHSGNNYYTGFFNLGGSTLTIDGFSVGTGLVNDWRCTHVFLTNGCLTVVNPRYIDHQSRWYTVENGATLVYPAADTPCVLAPSGLTERWTVRRGGRIEIYDYPILCGRNDNLLVGLVEEGGTLILDPTGFGTTANNYGRNGAVIENHGEMRLPHGLNWSNRSYSSDSTGMEGEPRDRLRIRQVAGTLLLGGDFTKSARNFHFPGEMTFELAGGTLEVTNTVRFYTAEAAKDEAKGWGEQVFAEMPAGATATVDVKGGSCLILTNATFGAETTLVKRGPGRLVLTTANRPTSVIREEGEVTYLSRFADPNGLVILVN